MISGKIKITEYGPEEDPQGYMEPIGEKPPWIIWWWKDGRVDIYTQREEAGAVIGEPITLKPKSAYEGLKSNKSN